MIPASENTINTTQQKEQVKADTLVINEIFYSLEGEGRYQGEKSVFIRTTGCPLRCSWCDTEYAFYEGNRLSIESIIKELNQYSTNLVHITGGEPLIQKNLSELIRVLLDNNYRVIIETGGAHSIADLPAPVHISMDIKAPASGESDKNLYENLKHIKETDDIKIVIEDQNDFNWTCQTVKKYNLAERKHPVILQPAWQKFDLENLARLIKESDINFKLGIQLHKYIYKGAERGV